MREEAVGVLAKSFRSEFSIGAGLSKVALYILRFHSISLVTFAFCDKEEYLYWYNSAIEYTWKVARLVIS